MHAMQPTHQSTFGLHRSASLARSAFSLTELLVVIGIIVLLVGLLLTALGKVQDTARRSQTESTQSDFMNACTSYQGEHGQYPGVIPEGVLAVAPEISSTENAILALMGGYRVLSPADTPGTPAEIEFNNFNPPNLVTVNFSGTGWQLKYDKALMGDGPIINGKSYAPYFTPGSNKTLMITDGQVNDTAPLPDLIDAWGQPIIYVRQAKSRGPLRPDPASATTPQFLLGGVRNYLTSTALGELAKDQNFSNDDGSILTAGPTDQQDKTWCVILRHPGLGATGVPAGSEIYYNAPKGKIMLLSAGPDGIYYSAEDGPGTPSAPVSDLTAPPNDDPKVLNEYDDLRMFGGG